MTLIHRLTEDTIGKIAAGEVIERPAAAVKELIENALDADAGRIDVAIQAGGLDLIDVRDDGHGIAAVDMPLAVERHATSKLSSMEDLHTLSTLGFRGEALASLAAVSDLTIQSVTRDPASVGAKLRVRYGQIGPVEPQAWGGGTAITARDLFENVPARRRFLRQPQTEAGYVTRIVSAYALAYPHVAFSLHVDRRSVFTTDGSGMFLNAAVAVWGEEVASALVELVTPDGMPDGFGVYGVVSLPHLDRATRQQQFLFAQGRLISSRQLGTAFEQAYHTLLMVGRHPLGCILVQVPPDRVDVNVHPTKAEVRFADDRLVFALLQRAVREAITARELQPNIPTIVDAPLSDWTVQRRLALAHPQSVTTDRPFPPQLLPPVHEPLPETRHVVGGDRLPVLRVLGQIASMFVIAEGPDGMYMIDQHAAHERIMFERVMSDYQNRQPDTQMLLQPLTVTLSPAHWEIYGTCREDLLALGFQIEEFGGTTVVVRGTPGKLRIRNAADALQEILDEMLAGGRGSSRLESLAISAACHASIRAGQPLSLLEMRELVTQLEQCSSPLACGHGRPTMLRMSADDLARQFSRR